MRRDHIALLQALRHRFPDQDTDALTALVVCRRVLVDGEVVSDPKQPILKTASIKIDEEERYVSRGGYKLEGALNAFALDVTGLTLLDAGASTGGFTDCLLKSGAATVHAVDVGYNQLDWRLRTDGRVIVHERTNIMEVQQLVPQPDGAVCDLSFRSITGAAGHILSLCKDGAFLLALIKPQFETPKGMEGFDGVIRERGVLKTTLSGVLSALIDEGLGIRGIAESPITGAKGNTEFFALLCHGTGRTPAALLSSLNL
ncbi:MAG: TlyA family RNA methyltransferase [Sphaerochaeta sp.]|nr:TlyA family RNA methyltransferase [Sphaerochaeta sp.]